LRNADSHTNADTDTHSNPYPDTNANADAHSDANAYPDTRLKLLRLCRRNFVRAESGCHQ